MGTGSSPDGQTAPEAQVGLCGDSDPHGGLGKAQTPGEHVYTYSASTAGSFSFTSTPFSIRKKKSKV